VLKARAPITLPKALKKTPTKVLIKAVVIEEDTMLQRSVAMLFSTPSTASVSND